MLKSSRIFTGNGSPAGRRLGVRLWDGAEAGRRETASFEVL